MKSSLLVIDLPLPHRSLHPNARPHFMSKAHQTKRHRYWSQMAALAASSTCRTMKSATVLIQFTFGDRRRHDRDSLLSQCKAYIDGLEDAGIVVNDADFTFLPVEIMEPNKQKPGVRITVTESEI